MEENAPAHISQDSDSEHPAKVATNLRKLSIFTHVPKDRNCDVCLRTKITKVSCRRRTDEAPRRAQKFNDLITTNNKVVNEGCESRDNHRCVAVVQDLTPQWTQSFPCETKSSHKSEKSSLKFLEQSQAPKVMHTDNMMEFGKASEVFYSWNHLHFNFIDRRQMASVKKPSDERRKVHQQCCYSQDWM